MERVTLKTKILVYLSEYWKYKDKYQLPIEITQEGIAKALGITVSHVPRELDTLIKSKLIQEVKGRVIGKEKRVNVYFLTPEGMLKVDKIKKEFANFPIHYNGKKYKVIDLVEKMREITWIEAMNFIQDEMNKEGRQVSKRKIYIEASFEDIVLDRKEELKIIDQWFKSKAPFLVVLGQEGIGKTSLIGKFIINIRNMDILMLQLTIELKIDDLKKKVESIFGGNFEHIMKKKNSLIIFDNYYLLDDSIVDFMQKLVNEKSSGKMIVLMREDTPSYNRFYSQEDVESGKVVELRLKGLPIDVVKEMFPNVSDEKIKIIYQLTGGKPSILKGIKMSNEELILKNSNLTPDQAKFLIDLTSAKEQVGGS